MPIPQVSASRYNADKCLASNSTGLYIMIAIRETIAGSLCFKNHLRRKDVVALWLAWLRQEMGCIE